MSDEKRGSTISHAHSIDPLKDGKLAENSNNLKNQFEKAKAAQLQKQSAARGSDMVRNDRPQHNMNPPSPMRSGPDRTSYDSRLGQEQATAQKLQAQAKSRQNQQKNIDLTNDRSKSNGDRSK